MYLCDGSGVRRDSRPKIGAFFRDGTGNGRPLHLALIVHNHARVVFEVEEGTVLSAEGLRLAHDHGRVHLKMTE